MRNNEKPDKSLHEPMQQRIFAGMSKPELPLVARNVDWLMKRKGINPTSLASELVRFGYPVPQPTIFRITSGESKDPRTASLEPIAAYFGVSVSQLREHNFEQLGMPVPDAPLPGNHKIRSLVSADETDEPIGEIPYWDAKGSCGGGTVNWDETPRGALIKEASFFKKYKLKPENAIAIYADGDSMAEYIVDGDIVIFDRSRTEPRSGEIFLIRHPDGLRIKQLRRQIDGSWVLESKNLDKRRFPDEIISPEHAELLQIVGQFVYRQGG
jgi:phage repressor protein C with HTH and peptisase S24 domain